MSRSKNTYWPDDYQYKKYNVTQAISRIRPGQRVFIGSGAGEPQALVRELSRSSSHFTDVEIVRLLGLESSPLAPIAMRTSGHSLNVRYFYLGSAKTQTLSASKRFFTPINLSAVPRLFKSRQLPIHVALIQCSEPDDFGWMSLGVSVDVTLAGVQAADMVIAQVNPRMPRVLGHGFIHVNDVDIIVEREEDLISLEQAPNLESANLIARHVAKLIDDGSTLQMSLGATPQAIWVGVSSKNDLGVHTQFLTDGVMRLFAQGVINNKKKGFNDGRMVASAALGSRNLYEFINDNPAVEFHPSDYVNDPAIIARHNKMVSVNVAMAMDLTGQAAADALPYNHYSGVNGTMDFIRGAQNSPGGKSILMLPSTTMDGKASRITPSLEGMAVVVPRAEVQYVVTEYGVVNLFGRTLQERAIALISVAHPDFRDELYERAKDIGLLAPERTFADSIRSVYPLKIEEKRIINGQEVFFRPARPTDERSIQEHFYNLDHRDVVRRFMAEKSSFLREDLAGMYQVDYIHDMTLVASTGELGFEKVIAVGGYFLNPANNVAEVAYSVAKEWQGKGISSVIQEKLAVAAREHGIAGFEAFTFPHNKSMIALFEKLPFKVNTKLVDDTLVLTCRFDEPKPPKDDQPRK